MKKLLFSVLVVLLVPAGSHADISIAGSYWDTDEAGEALGAGLRFNLTLVPQIDLQFGASYFEEFERTVAVLDGDLALGLELEAIPVDAGVRLDFGLPGGYYIGLGGTLFMLDAEGAEVDDEVGFYGVLGYELGRKVFLEVIYRDVEGTLESLSLEELPNVELSDRVGVDLGGFGVSLGFRF